LIRSTLRRGRHKVFIGMAPGVGKTCRMLQEGKEALREGTDVVIGLLETHGRQDTAREAEGLERVPRRRLLHRGVELEEMDVAAILARHPRLVLVDELAHTNAPGSERDKRWQDVEMLLLSGMDVYSTLNIQHLESLNDLVAELTGVVVRERIPNRVLELADEVVLVDVTPETLEERLREGKVYAPEKVAQAMAHFFQRRHLVALRELSLREMADRVENDVLSSDTPLRERVMVCLANNRTSQRLLRRAARLAAAMDAPLLALRCRIPTASSAGSRASPWKRAVSSARTWAAPFCGRRASRSCRQSPGWRGSGVSPRSSSARPCAPVSRPCGAARCRNGCSWRCAVAASISI